VYSEDEIVPIAIGADSMGRWLRSSPRLQSCGGDPQAFDIDDFLQEQNETSFASRRLIKPYCK